jgi:hypothetical protein
VRRLKKNNTTCADRAKGTKKESKEAGLKGYAEVLKGVKELQATFRENYEGVDGEVIRVTETDIVKGADLAAVIEGIVVKPA